MNLFIIMGVSQLPFSLQKLFWKNCKIYGQNVNQQIIDWLKPSIYFTF